MDLRRLKFLIHILVIVSTYLLSAHCAVSPKYHSSHFPRRSSTAASKSAPKELLNAPTLFTVVGTASWYGPKFHGRKTANGEIFDMNKISAAHKKFPLGTWLRVTNLKNYRKILVRVNDRGPFVEGRILDLSKKSAENLGFIQGGLTEVKIQVLRWGSNRY